MKTKYRHYNLTPLPTGSWECISDIYRKTFVVNNISEAIIIINNYLDNENYID